MKNGLKIGSMALLIVMFLLGIGFCADKNNPIKYIESDKYSFKVAVPEGWDEKFPVKTISPLQKVIDGYIDGDNNSIYVSVTTKNPYEEMTEEEFFNINLKSMERAVKVESSGQIQIGGKTAYFIKAFNTLVDPNVYQGVCILRMSDAAVTIYLTHDDKNFFEELWEYVINNSIFIK